MCHISLINCYFGFLLPGIIVSIVTTHHIGKSDTDHSLNDNKYNIIKIMSSEGDPRKFHGCSTEVPRNSHLAHMELPWNYCGTPAELPWDLSGLDQFRGSSAELQDFRNVRQYQ